MQFVDNTGHIFIMPSYSEKPIGYDYEENTYKFWIDSQNSTYLSINSFYCKVINILIPYEYSEGEIIDNIDLSVTIDKSNKFWMINPDHIDSLVSETSKLTDYISINLNDNSNITQELNTDDFLYVHIEENQNNISSKFLMVPIYVISYSSEEGSWSTNLLIHYTDKIADTEEYCPITVCSQYNLQNECLVINGKNMGVDIPKDILRSVYKQSFYNDTFNESLYNDKLKEYLINFMTIKGELGNFKSAINSLKWFGWGDKVTISKLKQTDNQFINQYIKDYFTSYTDLLKSFYTFRNSTYISLSLKITDETGEYNKINFNNDFWGEGKPILESLLDKYIKNKVGNKIETCNYWKPYFDWSFNELGLKLACLKYYYEKYFLPIHLKIHSASMENSVYANDIKMINKPHHIISEMPVDIEDKNLDYDEVVFQKSDTLWLNKQIHLVDENYNEFMSVNDADDWFYICDTCCNIPIKFKNNDKPYNCVLLLEKEILSDKEFPYRLYINSLLWKTSSLEIYDLSSNIADNSKLYFSWSTDKKIYSSWFKSLDKLWENLTLSTTESVTVKKSSDNIYYIRYTDEHTGVMVYKNIGSSSQEYIQYVNNIPYHIIIPSFSECNKNPMKEDDILCNISIIPEIYVQVRYNENDVNDVKINSNSCECIVNKVNKSQIVYESHFSLNQNIKNTSSVFNDFVIYPKMLNDLYINNSYSDNIDIINNHMPKTIKSIDKKLNKQLDNRITKRLYDYWTDNNFCLRLYVNGKWYEYHFKIKIPECMIEMGKLQYKYYTEDNKYFYDKILNITKELNIDPQNIEILYLYDDLIFLSTEGNTGNFIINGENNEYIQLENSISFDSVIGKMKSMSDINKHNNDIVNKISSNNIFSNFSQIKKIDDTGVYFNAYMHEPKLVKSNHINFFEDYIKYSITNNIRYISGDYVKYGAFYKYININRQKIAISDDIIGKDFYIPFTLLNSNNLYVFVINQIYIFLEEKGMNNESIFHITYMNDYPVLLLEEENAESENPNNYFSDESSDNSIFLENDEFKNEKNYGYNNGNIFFSEKDDNYIISENSSIYGNSSNSLLFSYDAENGIYYTKAGDDITECKIYESMNNNINQLLNKYINTSNITSSEKYLNRMHIFDIYTDSVTKKNILNIHNNISMSFNGVMFSHKNFDDPIYINGKMTYDYPETDSPDVYSVNTNTDVPDIVEDKIYKYKCYQCTDKNGEILQGHFTSEEYNIIEDKESIEEIGYNIYDSSYSFENDRFSEEVSVNYSKNNTIGVFGDFIFNIENDTYIIKFTKKEEKIYCDIESDKTQEMISLFMKYYLKIDNVENKHFEISEDMEIYYIVNSFIDSDNYVLFINNIKNIISSKPIYKNETGIIRKFSDTYNTYNNISKNDYFIYNDTILGIGNDTFDIYFESINYKLYGNIKLISSSDNIDSDNIKKSKINNFIKVYFGINSICDDNNKFIITEDCVFYKEINSYINKNIDVYDFINNITINKLKITYQKTYSHFTFKYLNSISTEYNVEYKYSYVKFQENKYIEYTPTKNDIDSGYTYIKISFYKIKKVQVRNIEYYTTDISSDGENTYLVDSDMNYINDYITGNDKIQLIVEDAFIYKDKSLNTNLSSQQPSLFWWNIENLNNEEPEIYKKLKNGSFDFEPYTLKLFWGYEGKYDVTNYLVKDMTGMSGKYTLDYISSDSFIGIAVKVIDIKGIETIYKGINTEFILQGNEKSVIGYIYIDKNINNNIYNITVKNCEKSFEGKKCNRINTNNESENYYILYKDELSENEIVDSSITNEEIYLDEISNEYVKFYNVGVEYDNRTIYFNRSKKYQKDGKIYYILGITESELSNYSQEEEFIDFGNDNEYWIYPSINLNISSKEKLVYDAKTQDNGINTDSGTEFMEVTIDSKKYYYGQNNSQFIIDLYNDFFDNKMTVYNITDTENTYINSIYELYEERVNIDSYIDYDFYLMHDNLYWYGIYISKQTIDKARNYKDLICNEKELKIKSKKEDKTYILNYVKSGNEFLINRMNYINSEGKNQFLDDDIIVATLANNDRLPVNVMKGSKWKVSPLTIGVTSDSETKSDNEMVIIKCPSKSNSYSKGYYDITVRYSVDRNIQNQHVQRAKFKIDKN